MLFRITYSTFAFLLFICAVASADPGVPDTVRVAEVQANAGEHFGVPIYVTNDELLSGGSLGFTWHDPDLFLDSVSYTGGVLSGISAGQRPVTIDNVNQQVLTGFFIIFDPPVPAGSGLWATLWFTADPGTPDKVIPIDSTKVGPSGDFILIAQAGNESIVPQYIPGSVTIGEPTSNTPPILDPITNQSVAENGSLGFNVSATDAESTPILSAEGVPAFGNFNDNGDGTGTFSFNPGFDDAGLYPISVIASDGEFADTVNFDLTVTNVNRAPSWADVAPQSIDEGQHLEFGVSANDPDSDPLNLMVLSQPSNASFVDNGDNTGTVEFDPSFDQAGVHSIVLEASDGDLTDTVTIEVTVNNVNRQPTVATIDDTTINVSQTLALPVSATDPDSDALTLSIDGIPASNAEFVDNGDGTGTLTFTPDMSQAGMTFDMVAMASDGSLSDVDSFSVTVSEANVEDTAYASADSVFFMYEPGGSAPDSQCVEIISTNAPAAFVLTDVTGSPDFVAVTDSNGTTNGNFCFGVNPEELNPGTYYNTVVVTVDGVNNPVSIVACLNITAEPQADSAFVSPDTLFFSAEFGGGVTPHQCAMISSTNASAHYQVTDVTGASGIFAVLANDSGSTNDSICVAADPTEFEPGTYYNTVVVEVDGVENSPVSFVACLRVTEEPTVDSAFISPDTLFFTADFGGEVTESQCAMISSTNAPAHYEVSDITGASGIFAVLAKDSGSTNDSICVAADPTEFEPGTYYNTVVVEVDGVENSPVNFVVCLLVEQVEEQRVLHVEDSLYSYMTEYGDSVVLADTVYITNAGAGDEFGWMIAKVYSSFTDTLGNVSVDSSGAMSPSMMINPTSGTTPGMAAFEVYNAMLEPGITRCVFSVTADSGVLESPQMFAIEINVAPPEVVDSMLIVRFDIKPGSCENPINNNPNSHQSNGVVPCAIIGMEDFDVHDIDPSTIRLEGTVMPLRYSFEDVTEPFDQGDSCGCVPVEPDGYDDMTLKFRRTEILDALGEITDDRTPITITGMLYDGREFTAYDCFRPVPGHKGKDGDSVTVTPLSNLQGVPDNFTLLGNYPNPFNPSTKIVIGTPSAGPVTVAVYNVAGQKIASLYNGILDAGYHTFEWDASDRASGVYFYKMVAGEFTVAKKMVLLK